MSAMQSISFGFLSGEYASTDLMKCRICKNKFGEFITLDSMIDTTKRLVEVFNECCKVEAIVGDQLPQMLCQACVKDLEKVHVFLQKVKQADYDFRKQLDKSNPTEINTTNSTEQFSIEGNMNKARKKRRRTLSCSASSPQNNSDEEKNEVGFLSDIKDESRLEVPYHGFSETSSLSSVEQKLESDGADSEENHLQLKGLSTSASHTNFGLEPEKIHFETKQHKAKSDYICEFDHCKTVCSSLISFQEHLKQKHAGEQRFKIQKQYKCGKCDKTFKTSQKLKQHDLVHTHSKDYDCPICSKRFATIYRKRDHLRMHANERNYSCEYCDKRFTTRSSLQIHLPLHTGERPHKCDICGRSFVQRSVLTTHLALHTGKTHKCPLCPKMFCRSSQLILHQRSHTGERPYKCSKCDCAYTQKSHLDRHVGIHLGISFKCEKCDKVYTAKSTLMTHVQEEHGDKLYKCTGCNLIFSRRKNFQYHMKTKHCYNKDVPPET